MPTRLQKRWGPRLRTAGALLQLGGAVAIVDRVLPRHVDPVLGADRSWVLVVAGVAMITLGAALFWLGRRWR